MPRAVKPGKGFASPNRPYPGRRFGRLVTIRESFRAHRQITRWECRCECGTVKEVRQDCLVSGRSQSCGCVQVENQRIAVTTHGATGTIEYRSWNAMKRRCYYVDDTNYPRYGGRGIAVCDRWRWDFEAFLADVGPCPGPGYSIDRYPNNDGDYEPGNVRWATGREQQANRRNSHPVTVGETTLPLYAWAPYLGISRATIARWRARGLSPDAVVQKALARRVAPEEGLSA